MARALRAGLRPVVIMLALALAGCTGGTGPEDTGTGTPAGIRSGWQDGEFTQDRDLCAAVSAATVARLGVRPAGKAGEDPPSCAWTTDDARPTRRLAVTQQRYRPPAGGTATREAERAFRAPEGWTYREAAPVPGLGDQAKLARRFEPGLRLREVALAVRVRNVVLVVKASSGTHVDPNDQARESDLDGRVVPLGDLEAIAEAAARDVLPKFGGRVALARSAPPLREGEIGFVDKICGTVDTWQHPLKRLKVTDIASVRAESPRLNPVGAELARACAWAPKEAGGSPRPGEAEGLLIEAEVVMPSRLTRETATAATDAITSDGTTIRERLSESAGGVADAEVIEDEFERGRHHTYGYLARDGNLLVYLQYRVWVDPPEPETPRWLRNESSYMIGQMLRRNPD